MKKQIKFDYTWIIVGLCFLSVFVSLGFCSSNRSVYLTAITDALGFSRGAFSLNDTFRYVTTMIINLFFGALVAKFGTKKLFCAGYLCLIAFALINSFATELIWFYLGGILLGLGLSWTSTTMVSTIIQRHCTSNKGTITGVVLAANGIGGAVAMQILSPVIFEEGNPFGYRNSYRLVALILVVTLALILLLYREKKSDQPVVAKKRKVRGEGWVGIEYSEVVKKPYFYITLVCLFLIGLTLQGLAGIAVPHMYDVELDKGYVAILVSISSLLLTGSKMVVGALYDRKGIRVVANISLISAFLALFFLAFISNNLPGRIFAAARIPFHTLAMPLETVMLPLFAASFFGNKSFDKVVGFFVAACNAGMAIGNPLANLVFDLAGSYNFVFIIFSATTALMIGLMQYVFIASARDRKKVEAQMITE